MYNLSIVTLEKIVFEDEVLSLILPGTAGYMEILTNHAPIITSLRPGRVIVVTKNQERLIYAVSGGFFEFSNNRGSLLADAIEEASEIDYKRAEDAYKRARKRIDFPDETLDRERAYQALRRAENRMKISREFSGKL